MYYNKLRSRPKVNYVKSKISISDCIHKTFHWSQKPRSYSESNFRRRRIWLTSTSVEAKNARRNGNQINFSQDNRSPSRDLKHRIHSQGTSPWRSASMVSKTLPTNETTCFEYCNTTKINVMLNGLYTMHEHYRLWAVYKRARVSIGKRILWLPREKMEVTGQNYNSASFLPRKWSRTTIGQEIIFIGFTQLRLQDLYYYKPTCFLCSAPKYLIKPLIMQFCIYNYIRNMMAN